MTCGLAGPQTMTRGPAGPQGETQGETSGETSGPAAPQDETQGWSKAKLTLVLYPLGAGAAAVNVFFAALITSWLGWPVLTPLTSIAIGLLLGLPITYAFAAHIHRLMQS